MSSHRRGPQHTEQVVTIVARRRAFVGRKRAERGKNLIFGLAFDRLPYFAGANSDCANYGVAPMICDPLLHGPLDIGLRLGFQVAAKVLEAHFDQEIFPPVSRRTAPGSRTSCGCRYDRHCRREHVSRNDLLDVGTQKRNAESL
jgi:hypothetical protein